MSSIENINSAISMATSKIDEIGLTIKIVNPLIDAHSKLSNFIMSDRLVRFFCCLGSARRKRLSDIFFESAGAIEVIKGHINGTCGNMVAALTEAKIMSENTIKSYGPMDANDPLAVAHRNLADVVDKTIATFQATMGVLK